MIPTDYRLDRVTARLIERLEGSRPTHGDDPERAAAAFRTAAEEHVAAAIAEYREVAVEDPRAHAEFLRREILDTALPRYHRLAVERTRAERGGFGFGRLADPIGRIGLVVAAVLGLVVLERFIGSPYTWPLVVLDLSVPLWPSIAQWLTTARYRRELEAVVADMARIQDAALTFVSGPALDAVRETSGGRVRPRNQEGER